jgi:hypothetical protein
MDSNVKLRLYISVIAVVMAILYVGPGMVNIHLKSFQEEVVSNCIKEVPSRPFDFCWDKRNQVSLPLWEYSLPYLPAIALLWLNWLLKPSLKMSDESFPRRAIKILLWLGLLAAALGIWHPIWYVMSREASELYKVEALTVLLVSWSVAGLLIAPLLFHHLVAPASLAGSMRKGKIALLLLASSPIVAGIIFVLRMVLRDMGK